MGSDHFWVNRRTQQISSLPKFILYSTITSCVFGVAAFCFASTVIPSIVSNILFGLWVATLLVANSSYVVMNVTCNYREVSKEEQGILKDKRTNEERRFSNRKKPSDSSYLLEEFNESEESRASIRESFTSDSSSRSGAYGTISI